jgi:hypothetical protein
MATSSAQVEVKTGRTDLDTRPESTDNDLIDIHNWLKLGDYVILHANMRTGRAFHACCSGQVLTDDQVKTFLENTRVIYVDVSDWPGLLNDGEWEWCLKQEGHHECTCELKNRVTRKKDLPHKFFFNH